MPRVSEVCADFSTRFGFPPQEVAGLARYLREAGLLTQGARGVNAPHATPLDAARILIGLMVRGPANGGVQRVRDFGTLKFQDGTEPLPASHLFEECFADLIERLGARGADGTIPQEVQDMDCRVYIAPWDACADIQVNDSAWGFSEGAEVDPTAELISDRYPRGFREVPSLTNVELLAIGQFVAGHVPEGWTLSRDETVNHRLSVLK